MSNMRTHLLLAAAAASIVSASALAAPVTWSSAGTDVSWNNGANWGGTAPANNTTDDTANFDSASYSFQPKLDADTQQAINGISFGGGATAAALTLSATTSAGTTSGSTSSGSTTITLASIGSHVVGEKLTAAAGIMPGTFITGIAGNVITISNATTATISSGAALTFTPTLTIGSSGISVGASIATVQAITAPMVLAGSQTWTSSGTSQLSYLRASQVFLGASQTLTLDAVTKSFNNTAFIFDGQDALTGSGTLRINTGVMSIGVSSGSPTANPNFSGNIIVESGGRLAVLGGSGGSGSAVKLLGTGTLTINGGSIGSSGNLNGVTATTPLFTGNQVWNGDFATALSNANMYMGPGSVSLGTVAGGSVQRTITSNTDFGGINLVINGVISNGVTATGITKAGANATAGKLTLNGVNAYTGQTIIKQGTVALGASGSIATSSKIVVGDTLANNASIFDVSLVTGGFHAVSGQTLGGFGTVVSGATGSTTIDAGATIAPGNSIGKLSFSGTSTTGALALQGNYLWELGALKSNDTAGVAGTDFDQIALTGLGGNLVLGGNVTLSFLNGIADPNSADPFWTANHTWTIVAGTNSNTNTGSTQFAGITNATWADGSFTTLADANGNGILTFTAVPEPATLGLVGVAAAGLMLKRRRARVA